MIVVSDLLTVLTLLFIWAALRIERKSNATERNIEYLSMSAELHERICQAESLSEAAFSLQESRGKTIQRRNDEIVILREYIKKQDRKIANRKGQITKLKQRNAILLKLI